MERTRKRAWLLDRARRRAGIDWDLTIVLNAGTPDESEVTVNDGWFPFTERRHGEVNSIYRVEVTERAELSPEVMSQADRLKLNGVLYGFNYDPPVSAPKVYEFYATELKEGGLR